MLSVSQKAMMDMRTSNKRCEGPKNFDPFNSKEKMLFSALSHLTT